MSYQIKCDRCGATADLSGTIAEEVRNLKATPFSRIVSETGLTSKSFHLCSQCAWQHENWIKAGWEKSGEAPAL